MRKILNMIFAVLPVCIMFACGQQKGATDTVADEVAHRSVYYWKSVFALDSAECDFVKRHAIDRMYLRLFDVATEQNYEKGELDIVPIATTTFDSKVPEGMEIVPVVYVTIDALRAMDRKESEFASLIVDRAIAMCSYNKLGDVNELQIDCDWTSSTRDIYSRLCTVVKELLGQQKIALSITVRLHQLSETPPPADRAVLMVYNTGALKNPDTRNSILDIDDVRPYMKPMKYALPLSYAYPLFGWGIEFDGEEFMSIVSEDSVAMGQQQYIRHERATASEILSVKTLVEQNLGCPSGGNILYHLDNSQLNKYTEDEINQILSH